MGSHSRFVVDPKGADGADGPVGLSLIADAECGVVPLTLHEPEFLHVGLKLLVPDSAGVL